MSGDARTGATQAHDEEARRQAERKGAGCPASNFHLSFSEDCRWAFSMSEQADDLVPAPLAPANAPVAPAVASQGPIVAAWIALFIFGAAVLGITVAALFSEMNLYDQLLRDAREATRACPGVYLAYSMGIAPFRTFAWFRSAIVCLSFVLVFAGAAFVLSRDRAEFQFSGGMKEQGSIALSSPYAGVLMMTLGALLVGFTLFRNASPSIENAGCDNNPRWARGVGTNFNIDLTIPSLYGQASPPVPPQSSITPAQAGRANTKD